MNVTEFYNMIKDIDIEGGCVNVHFDKNYSGQIRKVKKVSNKVVLSAEFDPDGEFSLDFSDIRNEVEKLASSDGDCEVVYAVPSKGTYEIEGVAKHHYDYRWDGDDEYDCCDIQCGERICGGKDGDIENCFINPDDYENFFENMIKESNMKVIYANEEELFESLLELNKPMKEDIDGDYFAACDRAGRVVKSFEKTYGKEMTMRAFMAQFEDIDF